MATNQPETLLSLWHKVRFVLLLLAFGVVIGIKWYKSRTKVAPKQESPVEKAELPITLIQPSKGVQALNTSVVGPKAPVRKLKGLKPTKVLSDNTPLSKDCAVQPIVFYGSIAGSTEAYARSIFSALSNTTSTVKAASVSHILEPKLLDLSEVELDDYFTTAPKSQANVAHFYVIAIPTYNIDTNLNNFLEHLQETHYDFRVDTAPLQSLLGYAVLGFGDMEGWPTEEDGFCSQANRVDQWMAKLTRNKRAYPVAMIDAKGSDADVRVQEWLKGVTDILIDLADGKGLGEGVAGSGNALESDDEEEERPSESQLPTSKKRHPRRHQANTLDDLENLGASFRGSSSKSPLPVDFTANLSTSSPNAQASSPLSSKAMVAQSSPTYQALTKQGYTIIGSHSGVKICRWTKSALRGRGSCYKHSFYGIASHNCMEATPSLSCSNKCVFCWRHGTNPVGTTWRWEVDDPVEIFAGMKKGHYSKIKIMRGVPGVRAERFEEAMRIRHCALSLVGEPIFYPRINELLSLLHAERISTFLVCNAQHPDQLASLAPVTQLYLSIDAADAQSLRKIDRPLHRDYWERFLRCLDIVRTKRFYQRTVYRLTLVKGFNVSEAANGYADLIARGLPCFVEVKGVTYCGTSTSKSAGLTMGNVPFYEEVVQFVEALQKACAEHGLDYGIAAEHAHSCCILMADKPRFWKEGTWWTNIDYQRFFEQLEEIANGNEKLVNGDWGVRPEGYMAKTPDWALWGNGGFDPRDERVKKKGKKAKALERTAQAAVIQAAEVPE